MKKFFSFLLIAGIVATTYAPATMHACSCIAREYSQQEKMDASTAVFVGTVTTITQTEMQNTATLDVSAYWKGTVGKTQTVSTAKDSAACGYSFVVGTKYIVYANTTDAKLTTGLCGFTVAANDTLIANLGPAMTPVANPDTTAPEKFSRSLGMGMRGEDVRRLQQYLNTHGSAVAQVGAGAPGYETDYFGPATKKAVHAFQEAHKVELGISRGTGFFGPITRTFVNK